MKKSIVLLLCLVGIVNLIVISIFVFNTSNAQQICPCDYIRWEIQHAKRLKNEYLIGKEANATTLEDIKHYENRIIYLKQELKNCEAMYEND